MYSFLYFCWIRAISNLAKKKQKNRTIISGFVQIGSSHLWCENDLMWYEIDFFCQDIFFTSFSSACVVFKYNNLGHVSGRFLSYLRLDFYPTKEHGLYGRSNFGVIRSNIFIWSTVIVHNTLCNFNVRIVELL